MTINQMQQSRPNPFSIRTPVLVAALALAVGAGLGACSSADRPADRAAGHAVDRTASSDSAQPAADRSELAPAALIEFRFLDKPPAIADREYAAPVILTGKETADLLARVSDTIITAPRLKVLENFGGSVRVGTETGDNAMLDGVNLRARVMKVAEDSIELEISAAENRAGVRTAQLQNTTVNIPTGSAAAMLVPDPVRNQPRFLIVSAKPDSAPWPVTVSHLKTNVMFYYGVSEVPAGATLPATDIAPGRAVAVSNEQANRYLDTLTKVEGYRFISSPAAFTALGRAATITQLDTDKAGLQTDGREMTATATLGSDKSLVIDMTARRRIGTDWRTLFTADDVVIRPDHALIYIEPARDDAKYRTILIARASAYAPEDAPRQKAAALTQTDSDHALVEGKDKAPSQRR